MESTQANPQNHMLSTIQTRSGKTHGGKYSINPSFITIDDQGDLILAADSQHLQVSSNVMRLASPVFRAMIQPGRFLEGQTHRDSAKPATVKLEDDDANALTVLCSILHFKKVVFFADIAHLAAFADLCDKYQCARAPLYHILHWLSLFNNTAKTNEERIQLLWVTYVFGIKNEFRLVSCDLIRGLSVPELADLRIHEGLLDSVKGWSACSELHVSQWALLTSHTGTIGILRAQLIDRILSVVQYCVSRAQEAAPYHMTDQKRCMDCDEVRNTMSRFCPRCGSTTFLSVLSSNMTRTEKLHRWLKEDIGLWPLDETEPRSPVEILEKFSAATFISPYHSCEAAFADPVESAKGLIEMEVARQLNEEAPGLVLEEHRVLT